MYINPETQQRECRPVCPTGVYAVPSNLTCITHEDCTGKVYKGKFCYAETCPNGTVEFFNATEKYECLDICPDGWYATPKGNYTSPKVCVEKCPAEYP